MEYALPREKWGAKVFPVPEDDQGDPNYQRVRLPNGRFAWYAYHTGEDERGAIPAYRSYDFQSWEPLGTVFNSDPARAHWAPCVGYFPHLLEKGLPPCRALLSKGKGQGRQAHVGHQLELWVANQMEGPFTFSGKVLTPNLDFAIDGKFSPTWRNPVTGRLKVAYARNFYTRPIGTGIVIAEISEDLTEIIAPELFCLRGSQPHQLYERYRRFYPSDGLNIPEEFWNEDHTEAIVPEWYCVEGWGPGYKNRHGRRCFTYSTGRYGSDIPGFEYSLGLVVESSPGQFVDLTVTRGHFFLRSMPEKDLLDPGHGCFVQGPNDEWYFGCHKRDNAKSKRQAILLPVAETEEGLPYCLFS